MVAALCKHIRSNVPGYLALIVAMSSGAYALSVPDNSVGTDQLKDQAVTTPKIVDGAVTTKKLKSGAVASSKIRSNAVNTHKIADGQIIGGDIAAGEVGTGHLTFDPFKVGGYQRVGQSPPEDSVTIPPQQTGTDDADCPAGRVAVGGGWWSNSFNLRVAQSYPSDADTWSVNAYNLGTTGDVYLEAYVVCVNG